MSLLCGRLPPPQTSASFHLCPTSQLACQRSAGCASTSAHSRDQEPFSSSEGASRLRHAAQSGPVNSSSVRNLGGSNCSQSPWPRQRRRPSRKHVSSVRAAESSIPNSDGSLNATIASTAEVGAERGLLTRISTGVALGAFGAVIIAQGGLPYLAFMLLFIYQATREYFGFVTLIEVKEGLSPPPPWASALVTLCCMALPVYTYVTKGKIAVALAIASFVILSVIATTNERPTLSSFTQAIFGLLYCGYLPTYWLKLRLLEVPALHTGLAVAWPTLLGGLQHVTVGFVATFSSIACVVAADCGAFFVGKALGRTPLTRVSPTKTWEGAIGGFAAAVGVALLLRALFSWPLSQHAAAGLGVVVFFSSILGDIIESVMKRDAGMKDSSALLPGHGGLLDRFDSYIFTGAIVHLYLNFLPCFGV